MQVLDGVFNMNKKLHIGLYYITQYKESYIIQSIYRDIYDNM
jgi:hypothetical protein